ncbi:Retrovirus-related pol polyprotein from transposon tnt 1-94 [Abeliophyllum distichum]|uniref:Retrovirus-related pol polyprotein from transposon tnt 1-94 n=1 Tax=Abeliophyllum distichum TaxID=126358 RepID=A0ABD1QGA6_9LAMI
MPTSLLQQKSPYEALFKHITDYKSLKVFGCACYPCLRPYQKHKFDFHTQRCVYLGPSTSHKGFKCLSSNGRIYVSRHVVFDENSFSFKQGFLNKTHQSKYSSSIPTMQYLSFEVSSSKITPDSIDIRHSASEPAHRISVENDEIMEKDEGMVNKLPQQNEHENIQSESLGSQSGIEIWVEMPKVADDTDK